MARFIVTLLILAVPTFGSCKKSGLEDVYDSSIKVNYSKIKDLDRIYAKEYGSKLSQGKYPAYGVEEFEKYIEEFKINGASPNYKSLTAKYDPIDAFISGLPRKFRSNFTLVHRSYSPQQASPEEPRVLMFGRDARLVIAFNGGNLPGRDAIEIISWNDQSRKFSFKELVFEKIENSTDSQERNIVLKTDARKCAFCHGGTPKPISLSDSKEYLSELKPIFPQYPLWPGFYGAINDIVNFRNPNNGRQSFPLKESHKNIKSLTFSHTEELRRLSLMLNDKSSATGKIYRQVVEKEAIIGAEKLPKFLSKMKSMNRYRHLRTLKDLFRENKTKVPDYLQMAPYRYNFNKVHGHYRLRPNLHLSTMLTIYNAKRIARLANEFPEFDKFRWSFLYNKIGCDETSRVKLPKVENISKNYDLIYPNLERGSDQYLLAYQYNQVRQDGTPPLPLHAWNLEFNEEIGSYHYGFTSADMNEVFLANLLFDSLKKFGYPQGKIDKLKRSVLTQEHFYHKSAFREIISGAGGNLFSMSQKAVGTGKPYGSGLTCKTISGLKDSSGKSVLVAEKEALGKLKIQPFQKYSLDEAIQKVDPAQRISLTRKGCEGCHFVGGKFRVGPPVPVDWWKKDYGATLHSKISRVNIPNSPEKSVYGHIIDTLSYDENLEAPYGFAMPLGRKKFSDSEVECELFLVSEFFEGRVVRENPYGCKEGDSGLACQCAAKAKVRSRLKKKFGWKR